MDLKIAGKTALVLAAGGGLGGAAAVILAEEGARVAVADLDLGAAQRTADAIVAAGGDAVPMRLDVGDLAGHESALAEVRGAFGEVDILINITGGPPPTPAVGSDLELWRRQFESMVLGVVGLTDLLLPAMRARGWGRIITSTSSGVVAPIPNLAISNALRLSLLGWSKTLAREVAADGVTVNVIIPGRILTPRIEALDAARAQREGLPVDAVRQASTQSIPVGRYGDQREFGAAVAFLAADAASYITGTTVRVDGGLIAAI